MAFPAILNMLDLAGIPLHSAERTELTLSLIHIFIQCEEQMLTEVALTEQLYADVLVLVVGQRDLFRRLQGDSVRKHLPRRRSL